MSPFILQFSILQSMNILFLVPYPLNESPSQRFRFEQYFSLLSSTGYSFYVQHFLDANTWQKFYATGNSMAKAWALLKGFMRRARCLFFLPDYDYVFIHREAGPIGPPVFEWIIAKIFKKKIIYDFDDAIWLTDKTDESRFEKLLRWRKKVSSICRWSYTVSCGNAYLADYARQFNSKVTINPTTLDTEHGHNPARFDKNAMRKANNVNGFVIGWTGSHTTLKYLEQWQPVLKQLEAKHPEVCLLVIADRQPSLNLKNVVFKPWSKETEVSHLAMADAGIMPLPDDEWAKGKCGFKALQYMALEIPALVSPVGVNTEIVQHGSEGFHCAGEADWLVHIETLISNENLRKEMGRRGREKVVRHYSVLSNTGRFLGLFEEK
jgi:glycosyltransferase involved in cell wall biosynthesis